MKISVIVPVYNTENYLRKCIQSIVRQTYSDWELIIVDDGSTDGSEQLIDRAAEKDSRIIAVHQINSGPGEARNKGLNIASGDFAVFIDSDDFIDNDYFSLLSEKAEQNDVVFIDVDQILPDGKILCKEKLSRYKLWDKEKILRHQMTGKIPWGGVRKAVSLRLLRNNNIGFASHSVGEEALYSFCILEKAKTVGFIDEKPVYFYVNHENSQSKQQIADPLGDVVKCMTDHLKLNGLYQKYADTVNSFNLTSTIISLDRIAQSFRGKERHLMSKKRVKQFLDSYDKSARIDLNSMSIKAKIFIPFLMHGIYWPVTAASKLKHMV